MPATEGPPSIIMSSTIHKPIESVAVIGLGYVGLPLALRLVAAGYKTLGLDLDQHKVDQIKQGNSYFEHIDSVRIAEAVASGSLDASTRFADISTADAVIICVPTPLGEYREPDLSYVLNSGRGIGPHIKRGALVVLESSTYPGTTDEELRAVLEETSGLVAGEDFHLAYSPEREDPGNETHTLETIPKLVGGLTPACLERAVALYTPVVSKVHPVSSCRVAEAAKLLENIFRSVNIALVNELKIVYGAMGVNIWEVIDAAATKPFGFMRFAPGPGWGGHCIPIDPFYLTWKARQYGHASRFIELAGEINILMPAYVVQKAGDILNDKSLPLKGSRILLLGLAYKPNISDDRESPTYHIMAQLEAKGAQVAFHDPYIPVIPPTRAHAAYAGRKSSEISGDYDLLLLCTAHDAYKQLDFTALDVPLLDTRNCVSRRPREYHQA